MVILRIDLGIYGELEYLRSGFSEFNENPKESERIIFNGSWNC